MPNSGTKAKLAVSPPTETATTTQEQMAAIFTPGPAADTQLNHVFTPEQLALYNSAVQALPPGWVTKVIKEYPKAVLSIVVTFIFPLLLTTWNGAKELFAAPFDRLDKLEKAQLEQGQQLDRIEALLTKK